MNVWDGMRWGYTNVVDQLCIYYGCEWVCHAAKSMQSLRKGDVWGVLTWRGWFIIEKVLLPMCV